MTSLTSESTWKELCIALSRKLTTYSHGIPDPELKTEYFKEALILTDHVWQKQKNDADVERINNALKFCDIEDENRASEYLEDLGVLTFSMDRDEVITEAIKKEWDPWPEPTDEELGLVGEPPITLDEMHTKAWKEHLAVHS